MKIFNKIKFKFKNLVEYFIVILFLFIFLLIDKEASYYEKNVLPIWERKLPEGLQLIKFHLNYSINLDRKGDMPIGIISPDAPFVLDNSVYVQRLLEYCIYKDFISVLIRTRENDFKIITLKRKSKADVVRLDDMFEYKVYDPREFYNDAAIFDKPWKYYVPCNNLRYTPALINIWGFLGKIIIILLSLWLAFRIYGSILKVRPHLQQRRKH